MKKFLLPCILALFAFSGVWAQCEYESKTDPITEQKTVRYRSSLIGPFGKMLRFNFSVNRDNTFMFIEVGSSTVFGFERGSKVYFKGEGGLITMEQISNETASYSVHQIGNQSFTTWAASVSMTITKDELAAVIANPPSFIRIETTKGDFDYQLKAKHTEKIIDVLQCIYRIVPEKSE